MIIRLPKGRLGGEVILQGHIIHTQGANNYGINLGSQQIAEKVFFIFCYLMY